MKSTWHRHAALRPRILRFGWLGTAALALLFAVDAMAQTNTTGTQPERNGKIVVPERPTAVDANVVGAGNVRPVRPERPDLPPQVLERINRFKLDARKYLQRQQELKKQLEGANDEQRAAIRQELKNLREAWLERTREMRTEIKDRIPELRAKLKDHGEVLDSVRDQLHDAQQQTRDRRGND